MGYLLRNPDLAKTYRLLARYGPSYLYDGPLGRAIVQADDHPVLTPGQTVVALPGIMTTSDLRAYQARVQAPTHVRYRGLDIYSMAPPSSSGSTVGEALNILSGYNLSAEPRATALFHYLEASRLAYADRNAYVGDPRYVSVPLSGLLSPAFAATRRCLIQHRRSSPRWPRATRTRPTRAARTRAHRSGGVIGRAATPTTSSPPTSGATSSPTPTPSTSSAAAARPCPATASCSTTR